MKITNDGWFPYADFITLLFAFFVVMFASAQADKSKAKQVSEAVKRAFEKSAVAEVLGGTVEDKGQGNAQKNGAGGGQKQLEREVEEARAAGASEELIQSLVLLSEDLDKEVQRGDAHIKMEKRGLVISFAQTLLFESGDAEAFETSFEALQKVARAVNKIENPLRLEGHTDSKPISNSRFHSNWELSAARSIAIMEILATRGEVDRARMSISGYADVAPVESNDTPEGRARNRRVDIVILNENGKAQEPSK